jgi:hypothetical protein
MNILQLQLKEPPMLVGLGVVEQKGQKVLPFDKVSLLPRLVFVE